MRRQSRKVDALEEGEGVAVDASLHGQQQQALISVTGLVEIMRQATVGAGSTKQPFTFYAVACVLYLLLTTVSGQGFARAERWASRGVRRA